MVTEAQVGELTIGQMLAETASAFPDHDAMVFPEVEYRLTWSQFETEVDRTAQALIQLGIKRGDHFGVWATNWPEWVLLQFATARVGAVLVTINPLYQAEELAYAIAQSNVKALALVDRFKTTSFDAILTQVIPDLNAQTPDALASQRFANLRTLIRLRGEPHPAMLSWEEFMQSGEAARPDQLEAAAKLTRPSDPINLQYTSGTTGNPKGALLTHRNLMLNAYYAGQFQRITENDRICITVPLYHCFGCVLGTMAAMIRGAAMVFPSETFRAEAALKAIQAERCTAVYGVPTMFIAMFEHADFASFDLSSLRTGIMAGSPCPIELMKRVTAEMGAREITIAYGQTEASPLITMTATDDPIEKRVGTVGRALPGVEAKVVDSEGKNVPDGVSGELCARGHNVMVGYYNDPEQTAKAIDGDGWLHTGDLAMRQADGYFRITGRIKDMIIRGGENISPREIEELLYQHPCIEDVQVVGLPDKKFGEQVLACIRIRSGRQLTEEEVRQFCQQRLARFKTPHYVWFVDSFPTTITGKIQKFKLREQAIEHFGLQAEASVHTA